MTLLISKKDVESVLSMEACLSAVERAFRELAELFPAQTHEKEGSAVLAPLCWEHGEGCLAIGSREIDRFTSDMDTLFVTYIGEVLSRVIQRLST